MASINPISVRPLGGIHPAGPVQPAPPVSPPPEVTANVIRQTIVQPPVRQGDVSNTPASPHFIATPHFSFRAGLIGQPPARRIGLSERRARAQSAAGHERSDIQALQGFDPIERVLSEVHREGGSGRELDEWFKQEWGYEYLQRYALYEEAREELKATPEDPAARDKRRKAFKLLDELSATAMEKVGAHQFRRLTRRSDDLRKAFEEILGSQDAATASRSLASLARFSMPRRDLVDPDLVDVPVDPVGLLELGRSIGGNDGCLVFLQSTRKPLLQNLKAPTTQGQMRRMIAPGSFPRYWLSMADARGYVLVQSALSFASDLCGKLAQEFKRPPLVHPTEAALLLLTAAMQGWGKSKADDLVNGIVFTEDLGGPGRAYAYRMVKDAVYRLPPTAWTPEGEPARQNLLEALTRTAILADSAEPPRHNKEYSRLQFLQQTAAERMTARLADAMRRSRTWTTY